MSTTQHQLTLPLQPYLTLLPSLTGPKTTSQLLLQIINDMHTYVFGEILHASGKGSERVRELDEEDDAKKVLKLFAYGNYWDYKANKGKYPTLTAANILKLKKLSIVTLAQTSKILYYNDLMQRLDIDNVRELEDVLIDTTYTGLLKGKLDQRLKCFQVHEFVGRDVEQSELDDMSQVLGNWSNHCDTILKKIGELAQVADHEFVAHEQRRVEFAKKVKETEDSIKTAIDSIRDDEMQAPMQGGGPGGPGGPSGPSGRGRAVGRR